MPLNSDKTNKDDEYNHPHGGHRNRVLKRFLQHGISELEPHNVLELLLFYAIPRRDTNEIAHELIETFGSLTNVFDASIEDLCSVKGLSERSATLLKIIPQVCSQYYEEKTQHQPYNEDNITEYIAKRLIAKYVQCTNEVSYIICLDNRMRVLYFCKIAEGSPDTVSILTRKIVEIAIRCNATNVILAHNHPTGLALPSRKDRVTTAQLYQALMGVSIKLLDHIIVAGGEYVSMAKIGMLSSASMDELRSGSTLGVEGETYLDEDYYDVSSFDYSDLDSE